MNERIVRVLLSVAKSYAFVGIKRTGKLIAINDAENTTVEFDVNANVKVLPSVGLNTSWLWHKVSFKENSLRNT